MEKRYPNERLEGNAVVLKKHETGLAQKMFEYIDHDRERLSRFLPWPDFIKSADDERAYIKQTIEDWASYQKADYGIFRRDDDEYLGNIGSFDMDWDNETCEVGYWILGSFEGMGYMRDAVHTLEKELFQLGFNRVVIRCDPANARSRAIPRSLGYTHEGTLREVKRAGQRYISLEVHAKLESDEDTERR